MEKLKLTNKIRLEICQRKFEQVTTKELYNEYKDIYHIQRSDIDRLYHDYLEVRELEILYHKAKAVLDDTIKHEEVRNALSSEWLIFGDEVLPRRYYKAFHHHFSSFILPGRLYTVEYLQHAMHEYTQALYALKRKCISVRFSQKLQAGTSDYYMVRKDYRAPRRGDELMLFAKGQNQDADKKTVMNYLRLIGYKFKKTEDYILIAANGRSKSALYFDGIIVFSFLLSSNKLHFMTFDDLTGSRQERGMAFVNALNRLYKKAYQIVE